MFKFDLLENEKVEAMVRQTEWVLLKPVFLVFVLIYVPWYFLIKYDLVVNFRKLLLTWTILVLLYAINKYLVWLLNVNLITSKRLVCVNSQSLFRKKITEGALEHIANISISTTSIFSSIFDYGDVDIQIMNIGEPLILKDVRQPLKTKDLIWKAARKAVGSHPTAINEGVLVKATAVPTKPVQKRKMV